MHALGRRAVASEGTEIGAAARHRRRRAPAGRARRWRPSSRRRGRRRRTRPSGSTSSTRSSSPSPTWRRRSMRGRPSSTRISATISPSSACSTPARSTRAFAEADAIVETTFHFGRHTGVTLEPRSVVADWNPGEARLTVYQGTQAPHMMQNIIAKHLGLAEAQVRILCKDVGGSFGIKVHVYADEMATAALSKLLRRPVKFVADRIESFVTDIHARDHRVRGPHRRDEGRAHHRLRDRRPHRHRPVFHVSAHQRHRGQPDRQPGRRALYLPPLPRPRPRRLPEQERHVPIPGRRPSGRLLGHRGARRSRGAQRSAWTRSRSGAATSFADDAYPTDSASGLKFEALVASRLARQAPRHDGLRGAARRAGALAREGRPSRHRLRQLHRGDQPERRLLRRRRRAHLLAGRRDGAARRHRRGHLPVERHRAGPGRRGHHRADRRDRLRRADRARARHPRRHRQHALWRRHLGVARRRHRRRGGAAGRQGAARERAHGRRHDPASGAAHRSTSATVVVVDADSGRERMRPRRTGAHHLLPPRHAAARFPGGARRDPPFRAAQIPLRLHQRHPGLLSRGRYGDRLHQRCCAIGWWRIAAPSSTRSSSTSRSAAASCRGSARRCSSTASTTSAGSS